MASASSKTEWPQSLKDFANRTFSACTDANRRIVQEELRALIYKSYTQGTVETTDWDKVELESLSNGKKQKKRPALSGTQEALADREKREKRARRFDQEKLAFQQAEQTGPVAHFPLPSQNVGGGGALAGRFGAVAMSTPRPLMMRGRANGAMASTEATAGLAYPPPPAGVYFDRAGQSSSTPWQAGRKGGSSGMPLPSAAFADTEVADPNVIDWDQDTVVGLSTKLEKPYLRLTSAPDPNTVRTLPTLQQTLELLKGKWRTEGNYSYICDQFKSMRQDLTVQRIKNDFTVKVYEIHARIALEKGDLGEYNQCQSQLRTLYAHGLPGCVMEFLAYRILYLLHTRNQRDVNALMAELTPAHKAEAAVAHSLQVRSSLATGNYHSFFRLYSDAPNMNAYIMDHFVDRERANALLTMSRCFRPSLPLTFLTSELAFADEQETHAFLIRYQADTYINPTPAQQSVLGSSNKRKRSAVVALADRQWDAKASQTALQAAKDKLRLVDIKGQI